MRPYSRLSTLRPHPVLAAGCLLLACASLALPAAAREPVPEAAPARVVDYLSVPGPIDVAGTPYRLAWSALGATQVKQEYLPAGETPDSYRNMVIVDVVLTEATPVQLAGHMMQQLENRKRTDPLVMQDLQVREGTEEVLLDFMLSQPQAEGAMLIEWNAYRYFRVGEKAVATLAISRRGQGDQAQLVAFLERLKQQRQDDIATLATMPLPPIRVPETSAPE